MNEYCTAQEALDQNTDIKSLHIMYLSTDLTSILYNLNFNILVMVAVWVAHCDFVPAQLLLGLQS